MTTARTASPTPPASPPLSRRTSSQKVAGGSTHRPGRALRWARIVWYSFFAPTFLYSIYVQLVVLKGPDRTPLPASVGFGRDSVFLTFHGNVHCTWYACLCLLHAFLDLDRRSRRSRGRVARVVERTTHAATGSLFPLATFVGLAYYLILHFHPLTRLRARAVPDHDEKMALLHLVPMVFAVGDALLKDEVLARRHGFSQQAACRAIAVYGAVYFLWSCVCVYMNGGHWPYPVSFPSLHFFLIFLVRGCIGTDSLVLHSSLY